MAKRKVLKRRRTPQLSTEPLQQLPEHRTDPGERTQNKAVIEQDFWSCFKDTMLEWNPSFSELGEQRIRFHWDPDIEAHDVELDLPVGIDEVEPNKSN